MDSGSLQSSNTTSHGGATAGDVNPSTHFNHTPIPQQASNFFNPTSFSPNPNPNPNPNSNLYNLDSLWSKTSNSDHNPVHDPYLNPNLADTDDPNPNFGPEKLGVAMKNPKKRTRASRRAPTTVLTTDTTNFRQMVQEFTGIPVEPFSAAPAYSRRLDLYGGSAPVRPSAQKVQLQQPFLNSVTATGSFHSAPSESVGFTKQPLNLSNLQNQMFPFQSVTQTQSSQTTVPQEVNELMMKRWRGENENLLNFEGVNGNLQNVGVSSSDGERQLPGNADSWSF